MYIAYKRSYFHKRNICGQKINFGTSIVQTMQKDFCLLCCINWYSWGIIYTSLRTPTHSLHKILQPYVAATVRVSSNAISLHGCSSDENSHKNKPSITNDGSLQTDFGSDLAPCYM